jgi:hypothetical protein
VRRADYFVTSEMALGTSLFLITAGAILKYAVTAHVEGIDLQTAGLVLMVVGIVGLALSIFLMIRGPSDRVPPPPELP